MMASDGNLWGVVYSDSSSPNGRILSYSITGSPRQVVPFGGSNGAHPDAQLIQGSNGALFGVTYAGGSVAAGSQANGVVFSLNAGLSAPKPTILRLTPSAGAVGSLMNIYGDSFVGASKVTFNGTSAVFAVLNVHTIRAAVPAGSTSGFVTVTNGGGTTISTQSFTVQ